MSEEYTLVRDIVCDHNERMLNIKKYYPFFKLSEVSFSQYKEGKYEVLDMGYILMAVLRFFIEENNFHEKLISYEEYASFMHELFVRDFDLEIEKKEESELISYIFDKLKNEGRPFSYEYFDPVEKKKKIIRTRLIDNKVQEDKVLYFITSDAITFYLDTKEIKDESNITVAQVLLSKMISTKNFKGGTEVIVRINNEVGRLIAKKNEILNILSYDVFAGIKAYEDFMNTTVKWFDEEQKLFEKNKELVEKALKSCESDAGYYAAMEDIYHLERELNRAMNKHSELLLACTSLQAKTDEVVASAKLNRIRSTFDFRRVLSELIESDCAEHLELFIKPLLKPALNKGFSLPLLDNMLTYKTEDKEEAERVKETKYNDAFKYDDELEEDRIYENYTIFTEVLFDTLIDNETFTLTEYNQALSKRCGRHIWKHGDYYSYLVHLCQKKSYDIMTTLEQPDTFLEEIICRSFEENKDRYKKYRYLSFELTFCGKTIRFDEYEMADIVFKRK